MPTMLTINGEVYESPEYDKIPHPSLLRTIKLYVEEGYDTGHFVTAVLANNLLGAVNRADPVNLALLPEIVRWVYCNLPIKAWGSEEKVQSWKDSFKSVNERRMLG